MSIAEPTITAQACFHCGEDCDDNPVVFEEKAFCCSGCMTVFQLLDDHNLCTYYDLEANPGISFKSAKRRERFEYLEDPQLLDKITDFKNDHQISLSLYIPNIHCASCVWLLENLYKLDEGIQKSTVNFLNREISLLINTEKTTLRTIVELLTTIGYEPEIRLEKLYSKEEKKPHNRSLWLKLGVAGFAFGNIMLFSFPDYLNTTETSLGIEFRVIFGVLNILLALPVLVYSSSDYLKSAFAALSQRGINLDVPISIGIVALFSRSVYEIVSGTGTGYMDSFTGLIFFLLIGKLVQKKTFDRLSFDRDYKSYLPIAVNVIREFGEEISVSLDKLKAGDKIRLRNQELVPADAILLSDEAFIDYSFITGESEPQVVQQGNLAYAGGRVKGISAQFRIQEEVENSYLTSLWNNEAFQNPAKELTLTSFADRISPYFTSAVLGISCIAGLYWLSAYGIEQALSVFTAVLIIACPCALALSTPFTLGSVLNVFSLNGFFVKNSLLLENFAKSEAVVFDKTGTLTQAEEAHIEYKGYELTARQQSLITSVCRQSIHPMSQKIASYIPAVNILEPDHMDEELGKGICGHMGSDQVCVGSRDFILQHTGLKEAEVPEFTYSGSLSHVTINKEYIGFFGVQAVLRKGLPPLLKTLKKRVATFLISGDNNTEEENLTPYFGDRNSMLFNQSPEDKLAFIKKLQQSGKKVSMIGDGLNDAGALKQSDFGIALSDDTSSFSPACDAIIEGNSLQKLNRFISFSKAGMNIILASFGLSLLYNITGLAFAITGQLSPLVAAILMPLSSVSVMIFTFFATRFKAQKMELRIWK
ncbi:MAG: HAD-IC family P-type ATPase [Balneolaceae bacterium]|nr:HAD-IC family P-type ATPase [Balneolaceae bacterium]